MLIIRKRFLRFPDIPMETPGQSIEPVLHLVRRTKRGQRIDRRRNPQWIPDAELLAIPAVKRHPRRVPGIFRHHNAQITAGRNDNRPETQRMRTNRSDHNRGDTRVDDGRAGRHGVRRAPGRGGDDQPVTLDWSDQLIGRKYCLIKVNLFVYSHFVHSGIQKKCSVCFFRPPINQSINAWCALCGSKNTSKYVPAHRQRDQCAPNKATGRGQSRRHSTRRRLNRPGSPAERAADWRPSSAGDAGWMLWWRPVKSVILDPNFFEFQIKNFPLEH